MSPVRADSERLQQVFTNLLTNALKFSTANGRIDVSAGRFGNQAHVRISDNGIGIDSTLLPHIFEPFRQADGPITTRAHSGLGLGLAICRKLVEQHGGSIHAASEGPGQGASFVVRLPLATGFEVVQSDGGREPAEKKNARSPTLTGRRVLLVEDETATRTALATLISEAGGDVVAVSSAQAALDEFQRSRPDLIVGDIGMAGEDGYQMMQRLRALERQARHPAIHPVPALALTAFVGAADRERALSAGFTLHLGKPIEPDRLVALLHSLAASAGRVEPQATTGLATTTTSPDPGSPAPASEA